MTYGVPYSFVPGTKARADEVNANFIDVLNKIDNVDSKVTDSTADGAWASKTQQVCFEKSITPGTNQTISIASFFPDKTNIYMFILDGYVQAGSSAYIYIESDKTAGVCAFRTTTKHAGMQSIMITGPTRTLKITSQAGSSGTSVYTLHIRGYRKIR